MGNIILKTSHKVNDWPYDFPQRKRNAHSLKEDGCTYHLFYSRRFTVVLDHKRQV